MLISNSTSNYITNDKLLKQKIENEDLPVPGYILMISAKKLTNTGKLVYSLMKFRKRLSKKHPYKYFDRVGRFYFVNFQVAELEFITGTGKKAIRHGINQLSNLGLIIKHPALHFGRAVRYELPVVRHKSQKEPCVSAKTNHAERTNNSKTNRTSKTVNTEMGEVQRKFKPASKTSCWKDSAKKTGLTLDTINLIAEFSDTYGQNAYKITGFITEARDIVANKYHVTKLTRRFEGNDNIINNLAKKLKILFSHITSKNDHKAKLSNYAGFLINSLKRFFKWTFGKGRDETVKPRTDDRHFNGYRKRKPEIEGKPQWMLDKEAGKKPKTKKTDESLINLIKAQNAYDDLVMQADDPMKPNPNHDKIIILKKRRDHYQKLYDNKQKATKPTLKPKEQTKQAELPKTDPALQREIQTRLRRLGEN